MNFNMNQKPMKKLGVVAGLVASAVFLSLPSLAQNNVQQGTGATNNPGANPNQPADTPEIGNSSGTNFNNSGSSDVRGTTPGTTGFGQSNPTPSDSASFGVNSPNSSSPGINNPSGTSGTDTSGSVNQPGSSTGVDSTSGTGVNQNYSTGGTVPGLW